MIALLLLLNIVYAFSSSLCEDSVILPTDQVDFLKIINEVNLDRPSDEEILNAHCKTKSPPTLKVMESFISKSSKKSKNEVINNVELLNDSPEAIEAFKDLTTNRALFGGNITKENQVPIQAKYAINPSCKKVLCAVEKIWGKELGTKLLYMKMKHHLNGSELAYSDEDMKVVRLKTEEIDDMLMALGDLPEDYQSIFKNQHIVHIVFNENISTNIANASIMVYDKWVNLSRAQRQYAMFHEFSHNISNRNGDQCSSEDWKNLNGWKTSEDGKKWTFDQSKNCLMTKYSRGNPSEDFAEALSTYRYNPKKLKDPTTIS